MIARLQQTFLLVMVFISLGLMAILTAIGYPWWGFVVMTALILGHPLVLAIEFALLGRLHGEDPTPRATPRQLVLAWWSEVISATKIFGWRQPFRSRRWPDHVPQGRRTRGLLLVHGYVCNRGLWNRWLHALRDLDTPVIAVNLEPAFGGIDEYIDILEQAAQRLENATGQIPVVVAHSMGGLAVRRWLAQNSDRSRAHRVITIGTPHQGTWLARFGMSRNAREMRIGSRWLAVVTALEGNADVSRFTCFYGNCDNIVFPPANGSLPEADNRLIPGVAHVCMADHPAPWAEAMRHLRDLD